MFRSLLLPCLVITIHAHGQLIEVADQWNSDIAWRQLLVMDGHLLVGAYAYGGDPGNALGQRYCTLYDGSGQALWRVDSPMNLGYPYSGSIALSAAGGFHLLGPVDGCDYTAESRLMHFDQNGEMLSDLVVSEMTVYTQLFPSASGSVIGLAGWDSLLFVTPEGAHLSRWPLHYTYTHQGSWANDLLYLAHGTNVIVYDPLTGPQDTLVHTNPVVGITANAGLVLMLTNDVLLAYDPVQGTEQQWSLPATGGAPLGFIAGQGSVHILTSNGVLVFQDQVVEEVFPIALLPGQVLQEAVFHADVLYTSSNVVVNERSAGLLRGHDMQGAAIHHGVDVAVDQVVVDSAWAVHVNGNLYKQMADLRITLSNPGAEVIGKVLLSIDIPTMAWEMCTEPRSTQLAEGLALQPGGSTVVEMPGQVVAYGYWPPGETVGTETCVVAQSPNDLVDRAPEDNVACASVISVVSVDVTEMHASPISIHPNPFTDRLGLSGLSADVRLIMMCDASGRIVRTEPGAQGRDQMVIPLDDLAPGSYQLVVTTTQGRWAHTVVKLP